MRFLLSELNFKSRAKAISTIIALEEIALKYRLDKIRKENLNNIINSSSISSLVKCSQHIKKMKNDSKYAEEVTLENRAEFTKDGKYIYFLKPDYNLDKERFIYIGDLY